MNRDNIITDPGAALPEGTCVGISHIQCSDIARAKEKNKRWKLIGNIEVCGSDVKVNVEPELLDLSDPLASISGNMNAVTFTTDLLGDVTIIGPGAGRKETGFALLNGVLKIKKTCQVLKT